MKLKSKTWRWVISLSVINTCYAEVNGYIYATFFENKQWDNNEYLLSLNLSQQFNNFTVISQIQSIKEQLRTLYLNYTIPAKKFNYNLKLGRINRASGLYENITKSPVKNNVSILPSSIYTRRLLSANFIAVEGAGLSADFTRQYRHTFIYHDIGINFGLPVISNPANLQREIFTQFISEDFKMIERFNNYNLYAHVTTSNNFVFNLDYNTYRINTLANNDNMLINYLADNFTQAILDKYTIGAEYSFDKYVIASEFQIGLVSSRNNHHQRSYLNKNKNSYIKLGYNINDYLQTYYVYSEARSRQIKNYDHAVGLTFNNNKYFANLEYHHGRSPSKNWLKYDTTLSCDQLHSFIFTLAYQFK